MWSYFFYKLGLEMKSLRFKKLWNVVIRNFEFKWKLCSIHFILETLVKKTISIYLKKKNGCYRILGIQNAVLFGVCLQNLELDWKDISAQFMVDLNEGSTNFFKGETNIKSVFFIEQILPRSRLIRYSRKTCAQVLTQL